MTLVVSEFSEYGIVMVADSAVTRRQSPGAPAYVENTYTKLHAIPQCNAAISMWGNGYVGTERTDVWIANFLKSHSYTTSISQLAQELTDALRKENVPSPQGFHLAGYESARGAARPMLFHVRNTELEKDGSYSMHQFEIGQEWPRPDGYDRLGQLWMWNGIFESFLVLTNALEEYTPTLAGILKTELPPTDLDKRGAYVRAVFRFVMGLHECAGKLPSIGEPLLTVLISPNGKVRLVR